MPGTARFLLTKRTQQQWTDAVQAQVGLSLVLLVLLAIPTFFILVQNSLLLLVYLIYPVTAGLGLYLRYRGHHYTSSFVIVCSVYAVVFWLGSLAGIERVQYLSWWIIALLPWVMFTPEQRVGIVLLSLIPVGFSFTIPYLRFPDSPLTPAERDFMLQILNISVGLGAFSCVFFLRRKYYETERLRLLENEFYRNTLNAIPLPIIIKDGITLDYVFFNQAAQLTFDLKPAAHNSNMTTFSEACAVQVSRLDHEVLRSVTYHIEADENLLHQTGLHWHFRTYRIPLELKSSGRRLLITVSEDLRALNLVMRRAEESQALLSHVMRLASPLLFHYDSANERIVALANGGQTGNPAPVRADLGDFLSYYLSRLDRKAAAAPGYHEFSLTGHSYCLFYGPMPDSADLSGIVFEIFPLNS